MKKQNVLWIMADQFNANCLSILGHPYVKTPNLDRLVQQGVRFDQCYVQNPVCLPSRVSFITGQYLKTHRQYGFAGMQSPDLPNIFHHFRNNGYYVGIFGKQHINTIGPDWGVDRCSSTIWEERSYAIPPEKTYENYLKQHDLPFPTEETHGTDFPPIAFCQNVPEDKHRYRRMAGQSKVPLEHNLENWVTNETIEFLEQQKSSEKPFFIWMSYDRPHFPTALPAGWYERIKPEEIELPPRETIEQLKKKPLILLLAKMQSASVYSMSDEDFKHILATYFSLIELIDEQIGRVLEWLEKSGLSANTHIVFTADHGDEAGEQCLFDKKLGVSSNAIIRIPFIWKPAESCLLASQRGCVIKDPTESIDLFPTLCELNGLSIPSTVEGKSLVRVFQGQKLDPHRPAFSEFYWRKSMVKDGWKLVHHVYSITGELYRLTDDPGEYNNLYHDPEYAEVIQKLKHEMIQWFAQPYTQADCEYIDQQILGHLHRRVKWRVWGNDGDNQRPNIIEGRGLYMVQSGKTQLFYRLDTGKHLLFQTDQDPFKEKNLYSTETGQTYFAPLQDALLDHLCVRIAPIDIHDASPRGEGLPTDKQVREAVRSYVK